MLKGPLLVSLSLQGSAGGPHPSSTEGNVCDNWVLNVDYQIPEDLVPFQNSPSFTRPSLLPIEAAVDAKLYDLVPGFGLFLGSQDAAHNDDVRQNSLLDLRRSSVGPIVSKLHLSYSQCGDRDHLH
eukprot:TRINITY_DN16295_c0_g1_i12.p1 TRINITY_DN16295_c0_g1~~TRINITY_DN16295_c0_g1_i12.p1  ORF type:complete len:126 (-),score=15.45 TRINITY_DN16295_c0_g1_i12:463-840(-)